MDEQPRAFHVAQKPDAEARALVRAFDQSWQIRHDEGAAQFASFLSRSAVCIHHAKIRFERGERIVGDFRARRGNHRDERGLACVRKAHQAGVCEQFEFEPQMALFAGSAFLVLAGRLMPRFGEMLVPASPASAVRNEDALTGRAKVARLLAGGVIVNERSHGHLQNQIGPGMPRAVRAFAVAAAVGPEFPVVPIAQQRVVVGIGLQINAPAIAAIAAGRTAARNEFLAAKGNATVAAGPGLDENLCFINEHGWMLLQVMARRLSPRIWATVPSRTARTGATRASGTAASRDQGKRDRGTRKRKARRGRARKYG